jgi:hypothetical protein
MTGVRTLQFLLVLIGALSVLVLGALPTHAMGTETVAPPCHDMAMPAGSTDTPGQSQEPDQPMTVMACCMACVASPLPRPPVRPATRIPVEKATAKVTCPPNGRTLTPEPRPPRLTKA